MPAPEKADEIKAIFVAFVAFLTALWGWLGWAVLIWILWMMLDYISGTAAARKAGEWSSDIAREGILHKLGEILEGPGLRELTDALIAEDEAERLASLEQA